MKHHFFCGLGLELANILASHKIMIEIGLRFAKKNNDNVKAHLDKVLESMGKFLKTLSRHIPYFGSWDSKEVLNNQITI
jgi:hypothetical protein